MTLSLTLIALLSTFCVSTRALDNGLALTPPMGWLSWEVFQCNINCDKEPQNCISERLFMDMADELIKGGYLTAGYDRINIDDCWMAPKRNEKGQLVADPVRFPNGIATLVKYMHSRGLKMGIYENMGKKTCMGFPGSYGHLKEDAERFASWNVDMVKMDGCLMKPSELDFVYREFGNKLKHASKKMLYSCSWPYYQLHYTKIVPKFDTIAKSCNMMRTYHDIKAHWGSILNTIDFTADNQEIINRHVGPGFWNDPDMLLVGNEGLTEDQAAAQFGIWALFPAPLLMSNDLRTIDQRFKKILLNKEVIAINQDPLGKPGRRIFHNETMDIFFRELSPAPNDVNSASSYAFGILNRRSTTGPLKVNLELAQLGLSEGSYKFRDVIKKIDLNYNQRNGPILKVSVPPTGLTLIRATPISSSF